MDVFKLRNKLIQDYERYVSSFINIRDQRIRAKVQEEFSQGLLWPEPLIQLNPSFAKGKLIDELVEEGILHQSCGKIFRKKGDGTNNPLRTHMHQEEAIRRACVGENYILTTGTGSGKSLAYIIPIVDRVLRQGSGNGIKAIVVYPMNALANSQHGELSKFLKLGFGKNKEPVTFGRYTGQESKEEREQIQNNPPDIILTNYMMLELILTRTNDKAIIKAAQSLEFLVLDELHTYRGRQGADVAMLIRRLKDTLASERIQCVGTSATLAGPGTYNEQQSEIAEMATNFFGTKFKPENIIGETLTKATDDCDINGADFKATLKDAVQSSSYKDKIFEDFVSDPLAIWIENVFGVSYSTDSDRLVRATPQTIDSDSGARYCQMLWIVFFSDSIAEPLRGLFWSFHQPSLRSQIHSGGGIQRCHISGFGWGVMTSKQPRRRRFHIPYIRRYWAGRDSSGDLLDTIYKLGSFNNLSYQFFSI